MSKKLYEGFKLQAEPEDEGTWSHFFRFVFCICLALFLISIFGS